MIAFLLKAATIHFVLYLSYRWLLTKESQFHWVRAYLLGSILISVTVPLLGLQLPFTNSASTLLQTIWLPTASVYAEIDQVSNELFFAPVMTNLYVFAVALMISWMAAQVIRIWYIFLHSTPHTSHGIAVRIVQGERSFSFFKWIFVPREHDISIVKHEKAHADLWHSLDILLAHGFKALFWWLPSAYWTLDALKLVHEFQADRRALQTANPEEYKEKLIRSSLAMTNPGLVSTFHHGTLIKRLNAMQADGHRTSKWKMLALFAVLAMMVLLFSFRQHAEFHQVSDRPLKELLSTSSDREAVLESVDQLPAFPGGSQELYDHIRRNLKYPVSARKKGIEGRVYVQFVVNKDGTVSDVKVVKGIGAACDREAQRVVENLPEFQPGRLNGKPVSVRVMLPITYILKG